MSDLKTTGTKVILNGKEYGMRFTLNVIDDIQDHFGIGIEEIESLVDSEKTRIKAVKFIIAEMINEDQDCLVDDGRIEKAQHVTERYVGRCINDKNMLAMTEAIYSSISNSAPETEETDEPENPPVGQRTE